MKRSVGGASLAALLLLLGHVASASAASRELRFDSGAVSLSATLLLPVGRGPHPGLVFLHGSGPHERSHSLGWAEHFVDLGFAALVWDKRGCGGSGGDWTRASLDDLAGDAAAALAALAAAPEVDPARLGFFGGSQAAWIAPLASARAEPAFLVLLSGGGVTPEESERWAYGTALDRAALDEPTRARAEAVLDQYFEYLATGRGREELARFLEAEQEADWVRALGLERVLPSEGNRPNWEWVATFDPLPWIERLRIPVLVLLGERDALQPTSRAAGRWRLGFERGGNEEGKVVVVEGADHMLRVAGAGASHGGHGMADQPLAPGVWETIDRWVAPWLAAASGRSGG